MPQHPQTAGGATQPDDAVLPQDDPTTGPSAPPEAPPTVVSADDASSSADEPVPADEVTAPAEQPADGPAAPAEQKAEAPAAFSDDTRPVPRDRGPVPGDQPPPPAAEPTAAPEPAAHPEPASTPLAWDQTADIRFAPGQAPGNQPPPVAAAAPVPAAAPAGSPEDTAQIGATAEDTATIDRPAAFAAAATGSPAGHSPADAGGPGGPGASDAPRRPWWRRPAVLTPVAALAVLGGAYGVDLLVAGDDVPRNTVVAGVDIGGLSPDEAAAELEERFADRLAAEYTLQVEGAEAVPFRPSEAEVALDGAATVDDAPQQSFNPWTRLTSFFTEHEVEPVLSGEDMILAQVDALAANEVDLVPVDATIGIDGTTATVAPPVTGRQLDRDAAVDAIATALLTGDPADPIELPVEETPPAVTAEEAQQVLDDVVTPGLAAPVTVTSSSGGAEIEVPVEAIASSLTFTPQDGQLAVGIDPARLAEALGDDLTASGRPAQDAGFEVVGGTVRVIPSVDGTGIDPAALATELVEVLPAPAPRSVTVDLGPVPADLTTEEAEALGIREPISSFTTSTPNSASGTNIRVVAEEVDGAVVLPGETFSLNTYTGPRGTAQGYVPANVISGGQLSTAVGGGISQFATTMFNAVFFAGLEDVYHKPHTFYISRYPAGREATVYEGQIDLQWRNDTDTGVFVDTSWVPAAGGGGSITVTFYGTQRYEIDAVEGPRTNYREPRSLEKPDDGSCIPQTGVRGFDVTVTRIFRDVQTGEELRRETFRTSYSAEDNVRCVPVAPPPVDPNAPPPAPGPAPAPGPNGRRPGGRPAG